MAFGSRSRPAAAALLAACLLTIAGCGGDDEEPNEAREGEAIEVAGVDYTVYLTRQLNPNSPPAEEWYDGPRVGSGQLLYASFLEACNNGEDPHAATGRIRLRDALDNVYEPVGLGSDNPFDYEPRVLDPGACIPAPGSVARDLPGGGALLAFRVPENAPENRPWMLVIEPPVGAPAGAETAQVELDL